VIYVDPDGNAAWVILGAVSHGLLEYLVYKLEVNLGVSKYSRTTLIRRVGVQAGLGAITGGITGGIDSIGKFGG